MQKPNSLKIIGGQWRSRKIEFPSIEGLRPTPNRVRETLFNWLQPFIADANCLDMFAGSGALGFEALSRGAASCLMLDSHPQVISQLQLTAKKLATDKATIFQISVPKNLHQLTNYLKNVQLFKFDVIFLDPPFSQNLITPCLNWLKQEKGLHENGHIYIETKAGPHSFQLPPSWQIIRQQTAGQVGYFLIECS